MDNILDVLHHNDGISGISLRGLSRLHQRKRGLAKMKLHRRTLVRMALGKKNKTDGVDPAEGTLTLPEEQDLQQLEGERDDEHPLHGGGGVVLGGQQSLHGDKQQSELDMQENCDGEISDARQVGVDRNDNITHIEKDSQEEQEESKDEQVSDEVDGEKAKPRRQSLLDQMSRSLNIDPRHPSQPPVMASFSRSKPDPADPEEDKKKKEEDMVGEEDSEKARRQSSLGESFLASIASLRSEPVTPGQGRKDIFLIAYHQIL